MQLLLFLVLYPVLWVISMLPSRLLYIISDFAYYIVYYLIRYRRKIVRTNLKLAFPLLTTRQRLEIERRSYRHLCDMFLEMIKTMTISEQEMKKRFRVKNIDIYKELEQKNKSIALFCGHYASYEWAISMNNYINFEGYAIYKKIANRHFDKLVRDIRSRFKAHLITTKETIPTIEKNQAQGVLAVYGFASDQSPKASRAYHWAPFMGITTPVHTGAEMLAKKFDMNVIFLIVKKVRRGYYEATLELLTDDPKEVPDYQISEKFLRRIEQQIYAAPEYYLWTHKRWKHRSDEPRTNSAVTS